jgi:hypothetical protein
VSIAIGIVAHVSRAATARALRNDVGAVALNVDDGTLACEGNHIAVLRALAYRHVDWCVVLEDDAWPVRDFRTQVKNALAHAPAPVVGLYLGYGNPSGETQRVTGLAARTAKEQGKAWIVGDCLIGSVGYAVRIRMVEPMLDDISQRGEELALRITRWAQSWNVGICYTAPSLVDHADGVPIDGPMHRRSERKAWYCGTRSNWDTGNVVLGYCPGWSRMENRRA